MLKSMFSGFLDSTKPRVVRYRSSSSLNRDIQHRIDKDLNPIAAADTEPKHWSISVVQKAFRVTQYLEVSSLEE